FVWNLADGRELLHDTSWVSLDGSFDTGIALDRNGARVALTVYVIEVLGATVSALSSELKVLDVPDGRERVHLTSASEAFSFPDLSPDGRLVAATAKSLGGPTLGEPIRRPVLWDIESGRERTDLDAPARGAAMVRFSPDGRLLTMIAL